MEQCLDVQRKLNGLEDQTLESSGNDNAPELKMPVGFKDPTKLTKWVKVFLCLSIVISVVSIWSGYLEYRLLMDFKNEVYSSQETAIVDAQANDLRQGIVGLAGVVIVLTTLICFFKWVYRANYNVRRLGATGLKFTPGWSVGWFFIPIANIWKPYQVMKEISQASGNPADWTGRKGLSILGWWWGFWLISGYFSQVSFRVSLRADGIDQLLSANVLTLISDAFDIPAAIITLILVGKLFEMQIMSFRKLTQPSLESDTSILTLHNE